MIGLFFCFCFRLRQSSFHLSDGVINGTRNGNVLILPTPIPSSLYTTPLMTLIFDFHLVVSSLTTPSTIPTTTPSLVKTSLKGYKSHSAPKIPALLKRGSRVRGRGSRVRVRVTILKDFLVLFDPDIQVNKNIIVKQLHSIY